MKARALVATALVTSALTGVSMMGLATAAWPQPAELVREGEGYRAVPGRIEVDDAHHWFAWEVPPGTSIIEAGGIVRPRFVRTDIDAVANASEFVNVVDGDTVIGGVNDYGNPADSLTAPLIADGDLATWWEPDTDLLEQAWVEIDLGRAVVARSIRVRFADSGDPFLMFRVLVSNGAERFGTRRERQFFRAGQVAAPNKDQRDYVFPLQPRYPVADGVEGEPVQYVRIELLGTDGPRGEEVSATQYGRLAEEDRGAIDYYRVTVAGREIRVVRDSWLQLPEAEQGPIRYYRRERPRLAEVAVEAVGDNVIALTQRILRETGSFFEDLARQFVTDGLMRTAFLIRIYDPFRDKRQLEIDLGGRFWLDRVRLISDGNPITSYQLRLSDGSLDARGDLSWETRDERLNASRYLEVEEDFPARPVRYMELRRLNLLNDERLSGRLNEIQAYGAGYVSDVTLTSPLIKFAGRAMVTGVRWDGEAPNGTSLEIRTRSGDEITQVLTYFDNTGRQVSAALWDRLTEDRQGPIQIEETPGPDWSTWSEPYLESGLPFKSPSPRRNALVQVRLRTFQPLRAAAIDRLFLDLAPPLSTRAVAEVGPSRRVAPGIDRAFQLYLRLDSEPGDPGFDRIRVRSSSSAPLQVEAVNLGSDEDLRLGAGRPLWPGQATLEPATDGVTLTLPDGASLDGRVLEMRFHTSVFLPSTTFTVELIDDDGFAQQVDPGDASSVVSGNSLVVVSDLTGLPLVAPLRLEPPVLTPNGDRVNDAVTLHITIYQLQGQRAVHVGVHDLSGRRRRDLSFVPPALSGEHEVTWDGTDDGGRLVPPGLYVVRVEVPTDTDGSSVTARTLPVVY